MKTKEKLELLWKYLLLLVLAIGVFRFSRNDYDDHNVMLFGNEDLAIDVEVEKNIVNGDTVMTVSPFIIFFSTSTSIAKSSSPNNITS